MHTLSVVLFGATKLLANEIYVAQSGSNVDLDITQDGENNQIEDYQVVDMHSIW